MLFKDRQHASLLLADKLATYQGKPLYVFGLTKGGVVTASVVAAKLGLALDVLVVKKLASPYNAELAIGAVIQEHVSLIRWKAVLRAGADEAYIKHEIDRLNHDIDRQVRAYGKKNPVSLEGKAVLLIDDGAATGTTMEAAVRWAKKKKAKKIMVAVPIISTEAGKLLRPEVDELVTCHEAKSLTAVSAYYESFPQVTDKEVIELLH